MASFAYVAKNRTGEEQSGFLNASNIDDVVGQLHSRGLVVLHIAEERGRSAGLSMFQRLASASIGKTNTRDLALFTRQLATVLEAGIPLVRGEPHAVAHDR